MKLVNRCFLFFLLCLGVAGAHAQCVSNPNDPTAFFAVDVNGVEVNAFCVGQPVNFVQRPGRNADPLYLRYGVLPGVNKDYFTATQRCIPPHTLPYTYTPTAAEIGDVTVSETYTFAGGIPTYYIRNYKVYGTPQPTFTVAPCPNAAVLVKVTDTTYDSYKVQAGSGPLVDIFRGQPLIVSVPGGATSVTVIGHYLANGACTNSQTLPIPALAPAMPPLFTRLTLQGPLPGGAATFAVDQLPAGYNYTLQIADASAPGGFRRVADVQAGTTILPLASPAAGCYRLLRADVCGGSIATSPINSTICTLSLAGSSTQNRNQLLLTTDASPSTTYSVLRNGVVLPPLPVILGGLEDSEVQCGSTYTYRVTATQPGGGVSVSNDVTITTVSALPPRQPQLVASINGNNVVELTPLLATPLTAGSSLRYRRTAGGQPPADFGTVATTARVQRDSAALADLLAQPPCYTVQVQLADVCNASPESSAACPALLSASAADPAGSTATLSWTAFAGPAPGTPAVYTLERLAADGTVLSSLAASGNSFTDLTPPTDRQVLRYRLKISGAGLPAGTFSYSNRASVTRQLSLTIPNAFTPNGDGLNDVLEVKGKYLSNYTFVVVDRNGQEVFRGTQRSETWDGTIKGHAPVLGAYIWRFQQNNEDGQPFTASGSVTLLK